VNLIPEEIRYDNIIQRVNSYLELKTTKCFAIQECEYYIYKSLVYKFRNAYVCRFIPHRIAYDSHGLYIESFGCALFILKDNTCGKSEVCVNGALKERDNYIEMGYKYIAIRSENDVYVSLHIPCFRKDKQKKWVEYFYHDVRKILDSFNKINNFHLLGDFNVRDGKMKILLKNINDVSVNYVVNGVDYIMQFVLPR
tara:strand:+ start:166 stop:756 length:591 start_codon:yes stop_codon:yes gene_type:complete